MLNRWQGNTGHRVIVEEAHDRRAETAEPSQRRDGQSRLSDTRPAPLPFFRADPLASLLPPSLSSLETEDIILLLILYLLYRESGDSELLMIMGGMVLL